MGGKFPVDSSGCRDCRLCETCRSPGIPSEKFRIAGQVGRKVLFVVGEAPGVEEDAQGRPFIGKSGRILRESYLDGFEGMDIVIGNSVRCFPHGPPPPSSVTACRKWLVEDLKRLLENYEEVHVLCVGAVAAKAVAGISALGEALRRQGLSTSRVGSVDLPRKITCWFVYHPAWLLRNRTRAAVATVHDQLRLIAGGVGGDCGSLGGGVWTKVPFREMVRAAEEFQTLALDLETYGIVGQQTVFCGPASVKVDKVSWNDLIVSAAVAGRNKEGRMLVAAGEWNEVGMALKELLWRMSDKATLVGANIVFDLSYLGVVWPGWKPRQRLADVLVMSFLENGFRPERSLKGIAKVLMGVADVEYEMVRGLEIPAILAYNAKDAGVTLMVFEELERRMEKSGMDVQGLLEFYDGVIRTCLHMTMSGVKLDVQRCRDLEGRLEKRIERIESALERRGVVASGSGSAQSLGKLFEAAARERPELPWVLTEKKGQISTGTENAGLLSLMGGTWRKIGRMLERRASVAKLLQGHVRPILAGMSEDGFVWPSWYMVPSAVEENGAEGGTRSVRITCKRPALQTAPREIKELIVSRWPGGKLVWIDYSQIELKVAAILSEDQWLMERFEKGEDLHEATRRFLFGEVEREGERRKAKMANFGILYGITPHGFQKLLWKQNRTKVDMNEATRIVEGTRTRWSGVVAWQKRLIAEVVRKGYLELELTGHRLPVAPSSENLRLIYNWPVQATAAAIALDGQRSLVEMLEREYNGMACNPMQVYDSVLIDCGAGGWMAAEIAEKAKRIMESSPLARRITEKGKGRVAIVVDVK